MRSPIAQPSRAGRAAGVLLALLPVLAEAAPAPGPGDQEPTLPPVAEEPPPADATPSADPPLADPPDPRAAPPPAEVLPADPPPAPAPTAPAGASASAPSEALPADPAPTTKNKKPKPESEAPAAPKKKKKKKAKPKEPHRVNQGTEYHLGLFGAGYVQGPSLGVGAQAGVRQRLEPKKNHTIALGLDYEYEPFSTKTLGFPEEDETTGNIHRTLTQPLHSLVGRASRRIVWNKLVTTTLDVTADAWWPLLHQHQRLSARLTPGIRIGRSRGLFGELGSELYYKKFPNYYINSVMRRIDQEGVAPTAVVGYNFRKLARLSAGFTFDFTHYLDAQYNFVRQDGTYGRSRHSKNYLDYIPFAEVLVRPTKGLRIRGIYAFERQKTQHYDRVMTGRDEFGSLTSKFFQGYYDFRRHRANLWISWDFRDRLHLAAATAAWVRHFDVYEARTADNYWTGELRFDAEIEGSLEVAVRVASLRRPKTRHDFFVSLLGSHVTRRSNQQRELSLATNFDISRVFLGFEVRGGS